MPIKKKLRLCPNLSIKMDAGMQNEEEVSLFVEFLSNLKYKKPINMFRMMHHVD